MRPFPLAVPLRRRRREDTLAHPLRTRILAAVGSQPGIQQFELRRGLGVTRGALRFHLHKLEREGSIASHAVKGRAHFFLPGDGLGASVLMTPRKREILQFVAANPGLYETDLAAALRLSEGSLSLHLHRLSSLGCLRAVRVGHRLMWYPDARSGNF